MLISLECKLSLYFVTHYFTHYMMIFFFFFFIDSEQYNLIFRNKVLFFFLDMNSKHLHYIKCTIDENKNEISCIIKQITPSNQTHYYYYYYYYPPPSPSCDTHSTRPHFHHTLFLALRIPQIEATDKTETIYLKHLKQNHVNDVAQ